VGWINLWSINELFETLQTTSRSGKRLQQKINHYLWMFSNRGSEKAYQDDYISSANPILIDNFLNRYNWQLGHTWSRRELLDIMKAEDSNWVMHAWRHLDILRMI
jgi:hypothetical protein